MSFDFALFEKRLLETMVFCHHILEEKAEHAVLWDALKEKSEFLAKLTIEEIIQAETFDWGLTASKVFETRSLYLETLGLFGELPIDREGELIVYFPDVTFSEGIAELVTKGYYDFLDCPPYSTWLYFVEADEVESNWSLRHIIAWIPSKVLDVAKTGTSVIASECVKFLDKPDFEASYKSTLQEMLERLGK